MAINKNKISNVKHQNYKLKFKILSFGLSFCILIFDFCISNNVHAYSWKPIAGGLSYTVINDTHIFQIDPKLFKFSVITAKDLGEVDTTAQMIAKKSKAALVINGGFFSPEHKSLGLLVRDGKTINPLHPTSWWAIFQIAKEKPAIIPLRSFKANAETEMALQVGPRLVVNGEIPQFKPSLARRSGVGIRRNGNIIIAVTANDEISMEEFANLFRGLECVDALNLDGGGSSQLYFSLNGFKLEVPGISRIANAITVAPRDY